MRSIPAKQARQDFTHLVDEVAFKGERYVVTRNGRDLVAVISKDDLDLLRELEDKRDIASAKRALARIKKNGTIPWEQLEKNLGIDGD